MTSLQTHAVKGNFVKEKPRVHGKRSTVQRYRHCDVLSFIAFEVAGVMVSWISDNRKMAAGDWVTVLFSLFFNSIRKKSFHTKNLTNERNPWVFEHLQYTMFFH